MNLKQYYSTNNVISAVHPLLPVPCFLLILLVVSVEAGAWSSTRLQDASLPSSPSLLSPSSVYPPHLAACQTTLCHRPSIQMLTIFVFLFISFHWSVHICLPFYCLVYPSYLFFSVSVAPSTAPTKIKLEHLLGDKKK